MREPPPTGPSEPFPPAGRAAKAMAPPMMAGIVAVIAITIGGVILWSPWDSGGSDADPVAVPTPAQQGTPNP